NHRILANNPVTWRRLDELAVGERVAIAGGAGLWPKEPVPVRWQPPRRMTLEDVAEQSDATLNQVSSYLYRSGLSTAAMRAAVQQWEQQPAPAQSTRRKRIRIPQIVDAKLGAFLGYLVGDGHISRVKRCLGVTSGDEPQARHFAEISYE